ncbi:MAG TPA: GntR family transcriptional regulator [Roseiarcus sp.]|nr:GntR family transcriptional regulator [Roseiarcus sp.]
MKANIHPPGVETEGGETFASRGDAELLDAVVSSLEEDIVLGRLHPRERLIEDDLMRRFTVKRHVIRRGLADLEQMGIVERVPNRGAMVRAYREDEIQQLYVLRNLLEGHAANLIPMPLGKEDIEDLKRVQVIHDAAVASNDLGAVFHANVNFHELLFSKTGNSYLEDAIRQFALRTHGIRFYCLTYPGYLEKARQEHWEMIAAIEQCDRESLVRLCHQHLLASRQCYEKAAGLRSSLEAAPASPPAALNGRAAT